MAIESTSSKRQRMAQIISHLKDEYPNSKCSLHYKTSFQLLVATILSAQCTDARVNKVTQNLFTQYSKPEDFATLPLADIKKAVYSTGFYNNKSKSIKDMSMVVIEHYEGEVPQTLEDMVKLPGVGRKTANVVLGNIFGIPSIVVDTHVTRITNLLQFVKNKNAVKIEKELAKIIDKNDWTLFSHLLIDHGRAVCIANRPQCNNCVIAKFCPSKLGDA